MAYPSLLWENTDKHMPAVQENTLCDLIVPLDFSVANRALLRRFCTSAEISFRGKMIWRLAHDPALMDMLDALYTETEAFEGLLRRYDKAGDEASDLLFPAVAAAYQELLTHWLNMPADGRFGVVRGYMESLIKDPSMRALAQGVESYRSIRRENLTLQSESLTQKAYPCGDETAEDALLALFAEMGVANAMPTVRLPKEADEATVHAYAVVYPHVLEMARTLRRSYADMLFAEPFVIRAMVSYAGEIAFLREMARHTSRMEAAGYEMCLPEVSDTRRIEIVGMRDMALVKRDMCGCDVVPNDVEMTAEEPFFLLGGANGGGKTTYLRALGLSVLFALVGCPIAARSARIYPFRRLFTHFPANETFSDTGRFLEEEGRVRVIRENADADTVALFNETFSGTYERKAEEYSRELAVEMAERGVFGVYVTHIHTLTGHAIPSLAAVVDPEDENRRTYKIRRVDRTDSSYARDILRKYGLDGDSLAARLAENGGENG